MKRIFNPTITVLALTVSLLLLTGCAAPGEWLYQAVVGGPEIGEATLLRVYAWHVMGLAIPAAVLIAWHGFRVRRDGGISSPERASGEPPPERVERDRVIRGEILSFGVTLAALILVSIFVDAPIGPPAQAGALVEDVKAPWILIWAQELLRIWPPAIAGVLAPLAVILILALLPYLDWSNDGVAQWFNRQGRVAQIVFVVVGVIVLGLTIRAALR